jgi:hypothetical protein
MSMYARSHRRAPSITGCLCRWTCQWRFIGTSPITLWIGNHASPVLHLTPQPQSSSPPGQSQTPAPRQAELVICDQPIENAFARLKDWRRIATRYDRCVRVFLSACALAAVVLFWL